MNQRLNLLLLFIFILFIGASHSLNTCGDDNLRFGQLLYNIESIKNKILSVDGIKLRFCNPIPDECGWQDCLKGFSGCEGGGLCLGYATSSDHIERIIVNGKTGLSVTHKRGDDLDGCLGGYRNELKFEVFCDENSNTLPTNITVIRPQCESRQIQTIVRMYHKDACPTTVCGQSCGNIMDNCIACPNECLSCSFSGFALLQNILGDNDRRGYQLSKPVVGNFLNNTDLPVVSYLMTSYMPNSDITYKFRVRGENVSVQVLVNFDSIIKMFEQPEFEVESHPLRYSSKSPLVIYIRIKSSSGHLEKHFELDWDIGNGYEPIKGVFYSKHVCGDGLLDITENPSKCDSMGLKVIPISDDLFDEM